jgi:hypothetical protein
MFENIDLERVGQEGPYSNVKFALLVEQRLFYVLLDNPILVYQGLRGQEGLDISNLAHNFDASPLVGGLWFDKPDILLAMLERNSLTTRETFANLLKPLDELVQ